MREALARLARGGISTTRHGSGTTVARRLDPGACRFAPLETLSVLNTICRKDDEGAAAAMPLHLENALERIFGS